MRKFVLIALAGLATSGCTSSRIFPALRPMQMIGLYNFDNPQKAVKDEAPDDLRLKSEIVAAQKQAIDCTRTSFTNARRYSTAADAIQKACEECSAKWTDGDKALDRLLSKRLRTASATSKSGSTPKASPAGKARPAEICLTQKANMDRDYLKSTIPRIDTPPASPHVDVTRPVEQVNRDYEI